MPFKADMNLEKDMKENIKRDPLYILQQTLIRFKEKLLILNNLIRR